MEGHSKYWARVLTLVVIVTFIHTSKIVAQSIQSGKSCAVLFENPNYAGQNFSVEDGRHYSNLEEYTSSSTVWNLTSSFKVTPGCVFTACNESYFDGLCQEFRKETAALPPAFLSVESSNCTCATDCKCSDINMRLKTSCARAYLHSGCNTCNAYYTDLKDKKPIFPEEFRKHTASLLVRPGCSLTVYDEEDYEGDSSTFEGIVESWKPHQLISSYECTCADADKPIVKVKKPRPSEYPPWSNVPSTVDEVSKMVNGPDGRHPALLAALQSLKHKRSSRNAYILQIGTTGSGKSSAINLLFAEAHAKRQQMEHEYRMARERSEAARRLQEEADSIRREKAAADAAAENAKLMRELANRPTGGGGGCLLKGTLILMADGTQKPIEKIVVGDMVLDHTLQPTRVVAALEKFLLNDTFYGFKPDGPYFFTNTHVLVGPSEEMYEIQLLTHSLDGLLAENPLFEFLEPKQMNDSGTRFLTFNGIQKSIVVKEMAIHADPVKTPENTLVHIIEVESLHGTYFANSIVCHHEFPPIEHWPNTMYLILSFGKYPEIQRFEDVPYTLDTVSKTKTMLDGVALKVREILENFVRTGGTKKNLVANYERIEFDPYEMLGRAFNSPSLGTFGAGLYEATGKMLASVIDNPSVPIDKDRLNYLFIQVTRIVLNDVNDLLK